MYLYDPYGNIVAAGATEDRQDQIAYRPATTGVYSVRVYTYAGSGTYYLDTSAGASAQSITLDQ